MDREKNTFGDYFSKREITVLGDTAKVQNRSFLRSDKEEVEGSKLKVK